MEIVPAATTSLSELVDKHETKEQTKLDDKISLMARIPISEAVMIIEGTHPAIRWPNHVLLTNENAGDFLVARLFTDAIFNNDIRSIQTIINRIDGGLPKDVEVGSYQTYFADCMNEVLEMDNISKTKVAPDDTCMMCLCKALFDIATEDIYWDSEKKKKVKPSDTRKQQRDNAMRMILERAGGRRTLKPIEAEVEQVELASWLKGYLETSDE